MHGNINACLVCVLLAIVSPLMQSVLFQQTIQQNDIIHLYLYYMGALYA